MEGDYEWDAYEDDDDSWPGGPPPLYCPNPSAVIRGAPADDSPFARLGRDALACVFDRLSNIDLAFLRLVSRGLLCTVHVYTCYIDHRPQVYPLSCEAVADSPSRMGWALDVDSSTHLSQDCVRAATRHGSIASLVWLDAWMTKVLSWQTFTWAACDGHTHVMRLVLSRIYRDHQTSNEREYVAWKESWEGACRGGHVETLSWMAQHHSMRGRFNSTMRHEVVLRAFCVRTLKWARSEDALIDMPKPLFDAAVMQDAQSIAAAAANGRCPMRFVEYLAADCGWPVRQMGEMYNMIMGVWKKFGPRVHDRTNDWLRRAVRLGIPVPVEFSITVAAFGWRAGLELLLEMGAHRGCRSLLFRRCLTEYVQCGSGRREALLATLTYLIDAGCPIAQPDWEYMAQLDYVGIVALIYHTRRECGITETMAEVGPEIRAWMKRTGLCE